eukprot:25355_1
MFRLIFILIWLRSAVTTPSPTQHISLEFYSRGFDQPQTYGKKAYIKINGVVYEGARGHLVVVINTITGQVMDSVIYDTCYTKSGGYDAPLVTYLNSIPSADRIVAIVVHDDASGAPLTYNVLQSWGCANAVLTLRESFMFLGTPTNLAPSWQTCQIHASNVDPIHVTVNLTISSTANPSYAPTNHPITTAPSSTQPGTIMCGVPSVGVYSNAGDQLIFEVSMAFIGELIFDASGSNFAIAGIEVFTGLDAFLGWDSDKDGIVSLNPAAVGDYKFILVGEATGIYYVQIGCVSDEPTVFPTQTPTKYPITAHHTSTHGPSIKPSNSPVMRDPTTAIRTVLPTHRPSHRPTPLVTTERPIVADTTEDEDPLKGNQSQGENGVRSAAFVVSGFVICCLCVCVGIVFHKYFWDDVKKMIETQNEVMISHPANAPMAANSEDWRRPQAEIAFERDLVVQWLIHSVQLPQYTSGFLSQGYENMRAIKA